MNQNEGDAERIYQRYQALRGRLIGYHDRALSILKGTDEAVATRALEERRSALQEDRFRVQVLGDFNAGKSTLINALLRAPVVPTHANPSTAVICEVAYGEKARVRLVHRSSEGGVAPARVEEIRFDSCGERLTIPPAHKATEPSSILRAEIEFPADILKNGVVIVDSPGLNEDQSRTLVTNGYLDRADAIILLSSHMNAGAAHQKQYLDEHLQKHLERRRDALFVVITHLDSLWDDEPEQAEEVRARCESEFRPVLSRAGASGRRLHCVSAKKALLAHKNQDTALWDRSSFGPFERELAHFLSRERGRLKLGSSALAALDQVVDAKRMAQAERDSLRVAEDERRRRLDEATRQVALADRQWRAIEGAFTEAHRQLHQRLEQGFDACIQRAVDALPASMKQFKPRSSLGNQKEYLSECLRHAEGHLRQAVDEWIETAAAPLVREQCERALEQVNAGIAELRKTLKGAREAMVGEELRRQWSADEDTLRGLRSVEQFLAADGGSIGGGQLYLGDMVRGASVPIAMVLAAVLAGFANPITLVPMALATGLLAVFVGKDLLEERCKQAVVNAVGPGLIPRMSEIRTPHLQRLEQPLHAMLQNAKAAFEQQTSSIRNTLARMGGARTDTAARKAVLDERERALDGLALDLHRFLRELLGSEYERASPGAAASAEP